MNLDTPSHTNVVELKPTADSERIFALDVVRGIALLGILLVNIKGIVGPVNKTIAGVDLRLTGADLVTDALIYIFAQGKFYPLFSILFGIGIALIQQRAARAGKSGLSTSARRLLWLTLIGALHAVFIRSGDILLTYAVCGAMVLLFFRKTRTSRLFKWGTALFLLPVGLNFLLYFMRIALNNVPGAGAAWDQEMANSASDFMKDLQLQREAYGLGSYSDTIRQSIRDISAYWIYMISGIWTILGFVLVGKWFGESGAITDFHRFRRFYFILRWVALPIGLALTLASFAISPSLFTTWSEQTFLAGALSLLGSGGMALGYFAWLMYILQNDRRVTMMKQLGYAGRMALPNYIMQSVVCILIFYNFGLGYYEQLSRAGQVPFAIILFALQVVISKGWLSSHRYGPLEWLWRVATYGKAAGGR